MDDKKTVMHVTGTMNFGGAEVLMMNIVRKLHHQFNFIFLVNESKGKRVKGDFDDEIISLGAKIIYCDSMRAVGIRNYQKQLVALLKEWKPDVVHCHLNSKCGIVSKCAHKAGIRKIISHSHAALKFRGNLIKSAMLYAELYWQRRMINKYSTDFWGCSQEALSSLFYKRNRNGGRCKVVNNLIEAKRFIYPNDVTVGKYKEEYNPNHKFAIGVIGRIAPVKNYLFALEIARELKKIEQNFVLFIVGLKQDLEYVERLFEKMNEWELTEYVVYVEPKKDVENCYAMMDVVLGTSLREGFSLTAVEAQLSGAYTLLSNGYPKGVNLEAGNCECLDNFDAKVWAQKVYSIMTASVQVSKEARKAALEKRGFDLDAEIYKIAEEYEK